MLNQIVQLREEHTTLARWRHFKRGELTQETVEGVVISLASQAHRFSFLNLTLKSLLVQTQLPSRIVVNIDPGAKKLLPPSCRTLEAFGVEFREAFQILGPYTKLIPTLRQYRHSAIVTADDDINYHPTWLEEMLEGHSSNPGCIVGHRAAHIGVDARGEFLPYRDWPFVEESTRGFGLILTGVGGILYPKTVITSDWDQPEVFLKLAPTADDLWFLIMSTRNRIPRVRIRTKRSDPISWFGSQRRALWRTNVATGANDTQLSALLNFFHMEALDICEPK